MIHIDGALLEGGGQSTYQGATQLIRGFEKRFSICLHPWRRDSRPRYPSEPVPGLIEQPLSGVRLLAEISKGGLEGGQLGSQEIVLRPGNGIIGREFSSECAGYVCFRQG